MAAAMDVFEGYSYAQLYWLVFLLLNGLFIVYSSVTGTFLDLKKQARPVEDNIGLLKFHKRVSFMHFLSIITGLWILWNITSSYYFGGQAGYYFTELNSILFTPKSATPVDATSIVLACIAWLVTRVYRYHISVSVSVFSRRQTYKIHGSSHRSLTKLRKNRFGHVTTTDYKLPVGGGLDVVSCPHYFAEILSYVAIGLVLGCGSYTWWIMTAFVTSTHYLLAVNTHRFYSQKFEDFPKNKKMLVPYLL